mgnify:CR=1 FL=1
MHEYQCGDNIKIIHGDSMQILPRLPRASFDLIILDPPFMEWSGKVSARL